MSRFPPTFVLSAGRTGTVFLTHTLPAHVPELHAVHAPSAQEVLVPAPVALLAALQVHLTYTKHFCTRGLTTSTAII